MYPEVFYSLLFLLPPAAHGRDSRFLDVRDTREIRQPTSTRTHEPCPLITTNTLPWDAEDNSCTFSYFSQWGYSNPGWADPPVLNITLNGVPVVATVDTGSTGLVASLSYFNKADFVLDVKASIFYSSSHWLEQGYEARINMTFGPFFMQPKVLIKESEVCCPTFDKTKDGHRCPAEKKAKSCNCEPEGCPEAAKREAFFDDYSPRRRVAPAAHRVYMGVGFGRLVTPDANPFFSVKTLNGASIQGNTAFCPGYVIAEDGFHYGLNKENTRDFGFFELQKQDIAGQRDWATPQMEYSINNGQFYQGTVLMDTGIPQMYLSPTPDWKQGDSLSLAIPSVKDSVAVANYTIGKRPTNNPIQPEAVSHSLQAGYINTGRMLLSCFDVAFDPTFGHFGYRYMGAGRTNCSDFTSV